MKMKRVLLLVVVVTLSVSALYGQGTPGLEFSIIRDMPYYEVSRGTATDAHIIIPETHNGIAVIAIAEYGFYSFEDLISISLPSTLLWIGESAFYGCSNLESISIPESVVAIADAAFFNCKSLVGVVLPPMLRVIGKGQHIRSLVNDYFPEGTHSVIWDGTDDSGNRAGSGVYFYRMRSKDSLNETNTVM